MARRQPERRERDRGVVSVLSVFFVLLLLTFLALVINVGRLMRARGDLQHAADSAALAAMEVLDNKPGAPPTIAPGRSATDYDVNSARSIQGMAVLMAQKHLVVSGAGQLPTVSTTYGDDIVADDFVAGFWHVKPDERCIFDNLANCNAGGAAPFEPVPVGAWPPG